MNEQRQRDDCHVKRRKPIVLMIGTLLLCLFAFGANYYREELTDSMFSFDFAIANFITVFGVVLLTIGWLFWLWFLSKSSPIFSRVIPIMAMLAIAGFLVTFRPVFQGGMLVNRWEPRFWDSQKLAGATDELATDLTNESPSDFSQFMGSQRNGVISNFSAPLDSFYSTERLFKQDIGAGWSGIVARNGFAITMEQRAEKESVVCYEIETGVVAWIYGHERRFDELMGYVGPRATPTLDQGRVYAMGANGVLVCLDVNSGELIWQQDLIPLLGIELKVGTDRKGMGYQTEKSNVMWGRSGSPLIVEDLVVVPAGGPQDGEQTSLIAFNKSDGTEVWRGGDDGIGYSSPNLYQLAGKKQIVIVNESSVSGHDPKTGQTLWSYVRPGTTNADANTSQAVLVGDNRLLVSKGYGMGGELIEISMESDNAFKVKSIWKNSKVLKTKLTSAIVKDGYAYALSDGILECVDLENGQRVWKKGRFGHGQMLLVGDKLVVHGERGTLNLVNAQPNGFVKSEEMETVSGVCWNTFCVYDRYIIVRSDLEMACFKVSDDQ